MTSARGSLGVVAVVLWATVILGAAPGRIDPRFVLDEPADWAPPPADSATIYLIREQVVRLLPLPYETIYLDGRPAGLLPQKTWFACRVAAGRHRLTGIGACPEVWLRCAAGRAYLLRLREVVDENDQLHAGLLFDDPESLARLIRRGGLQRVTTTQAGWNYLQRKIRSNAGAPADAGAYTSPGPVADTLRHMLCERPLDQVNLENDFSQLTGTVVLDAGAIRYRLREQVKATVTSSRWVEDSLTIRYDDIVLARFGGTRFSGASPWISIVYRSPVGQRLVSFGDQREAQGAETYNRFFAALQAGVPAMWRRTPGAGSDSVRSGPGAGREP